MERIGTVFETMLPGSGPTGTRAWQTLALIILLIVAAGVYINAAGNGFVYDDALQVLDNNWIRDIRFIPDIFTSSVWKFKYGAEANYYRPMMHVLYMLDYTLFGSEPWGFHLTNILFHVLTSGLVFLIAGKLFERYRPADPARVPSAFIAGLLFATHPIHTEAVVWVAALPELSYTFFFLLSFYLYLRSEEGAGGRHALSVAAFFLAALCKEPALTLPAVLIAYDGLLSGNTAGIRSRFGKFAPYLLVAGVYLAMRLYALGGFAPFEPHIQSDVPGYLINVFPLFTQYLVKLLLPVNLNFYHVFHPISSLLEMRGLLSAAVTAAFAGAAVISFRKNRLVFFSLLLIVAPLLPALYIPALGQNAFAERYLYLSSFGFAMLVAQALSRLQFFGRKHAGWPVGIAVALAVLYSYGTVCRNAVWRNEETLYSDTIRKSPEAAQIRYNLGMLYERSGRLDEAIEQYRTAIAIHFNDTRAHNNLGIAYVKQGRPDLAINEFTTAIMIKPDNAEAHNNLGNALAGQGRLKEAAGAYRTALQVYPGYADAHYNLGSVYARLGRVQASAYEFRVALELNPNDADARRSLEELSGKAAR